MDALAQRIQRTWGEKPARERLVVEAAVVGGLVAATAALPRIPQPESYHAFAGDHRTLLGIPHAPNVLSNAGIAAAGLLGLLQLWAGSRGALGASPKAAATAAGTSEGQGNGATAAEPAHPAMGPPGAGPEGEEGAGGSSVGGAPGQALLWAATFGSMLFTAWGSAYYHLAPSTLRLAADRLGMALTFSLLTATIWVDRRGWPRGALAWAAAAAAMLAPPASVLYWEASEAAGAGDLRWYRLRQALSAAAVACTALCYHPRTWCPTSSPGGLLAALAWYGAAVLCDRLDRPVYWLTLGTVGGHTWKHVLAGVAGWQLARMLRGTAAQRRAGSE